MRPPHFDRRSAAALAAAAFAAAAASPLFAQSTERPKPPGTAPLEEVPPPPPITSIERGNEPEPQVSTRTQGDETIQEYRLNGKLYMMRVTPKHGHPYVLMDNRGDGTFVRQDNPLDSGLRVPQWVLLEF
jgi:uncharacterized protein DUF2782